MVARSAAGFRRQTRLQRRQLYRNGNYRRGRGASGGRCDSWTGGFFALEDNKGLIAQRKGDGHVRVSALFRMAENDFASLGISFTDPAATRAAILAQFQDWSLEIKGLINVCDESFFARPITALPVGIRWASQQRVTLVGDAAHQMSPFAGAGANLAMQDGAEFALELLKLQEPPVAIAAYEKKMFERAKVAAQRSAEGLEMCISPHGATLFAKRMAQYQALRREA